MKYLVILTMLLSIPAFATENSCGDSCGVTAEQKSCVLKRDCHVQAYRQQIAKLKQQLKETEAKLAAEQAREPKVVVQTQVVREYVDVSRTPERDSISLIVPLAPTHLVVTRTATDYTAKNEYHLDLGAMYQHDFDDGFRATLGLTFGGTGLFGLGFTF